MKNLYLRVQDYHLDWFLIFLGSFTLRLIGINYGLPYEHHPDEEYIFGNVDKTLNSGSWYPGVYNWGYIFYYITHFTSLLARFFVKTEYIREYEVLFTRVVIVFISSLVIIVLYEIARRIYQRRFYSFMVAAFLAVSGIFVIHSRYPVSDNLIALFVSCTVLTAVNYLQNRSRKNLLILFVVAGISVSPKLSYALLFIYAAFVFLMVKKFKLLKKNLFSLVKLTFLSLGFFFLGNLFEIFHFKTWIGRNLYFYRSYSGTDNFYFKDLRLDYFDHLFSMLQLSLADAFIVTNFSAVITIFMIGLLLYKSVYFYKKDKRLFWAIAFIPVLFLLSVSSRKVFLIRTVLPIVPLLWLILFYPVKYRKNLEMAVRAAVFIIFSVILLSTYRQVQDFTSKNIEPKLMSYISNSNHIFAVPYVFQFPSLEYAYWSSEIPLNLTGNDFFKKNASKLIYYKKEDNIGKILSQVDFFVTEHLVLEAYDYRRSNRLKLEPSFSLIDIKSEQELNNLLKKYLFTPVWFLDTSPYEAVLKYDPTYSGYKKFVVYKKQNLKGLSL